MTWKRVPKTVNGAMVRMRGAVQPHLREHGGWILLQRSVSEDGCLEEIGAWMCLLSLVTHVRSGRAR